MNDLSDVASKATIGLVGTTWSLLDTWMSIAAGTATCIYMLICIYQKLYPKGT